MKTSKFKKFLAPAIIILGIASAHADELLLINGDVLQGELVSKENGRIRFASPVLGTIDVDETKASVIVGGESPKKTGKATTQDGSPKPPRRAGGDTTGMGSKVQPWRSKVDFGFNWQEGRKDRQDISVRFESERKFQRNNLRVQARYVFTENDGATSADRHEAGLRWRREFNDRWFSQTQTTYYDDAVRSIDLNVNQNVGFGYRLLNSDHASANVGAGLSVQYRDAADVDDAFGQFGEVFQDLVWRFNERVEFAQEAGALFSPEGQLLPSRTGNSSHYTLTDTPNYRFTFQSVLRGRVTESVSVNLRFEYEFDNAIADRDARSDQRISTSLGYMF